MSESSVSQAESTKKATRRDHIFAFLVLGAVFAALLAQTWRKWADFVIDYGLQLYCPWRISTGSVLYRDIAYLSGGPFSQYWHAALFKTFGVSFIVLALSNICFTVALLVVVYRCLYRCSDQLTAIAGTLSIVCAFVFANYTGMGIFNYITPYCNEVFHALVFAVMSVAFLGGWLRQPRTTAAIGMGFCAALVFLTKPEVFVALAVTFCFGFYLWTRTGHSYRPVLRALGWMVAAGMVPMAAFYIYFCSKMDFVSAAKAVCGGWMPLLTTHTYDITYFQWCVGMDTPGTHLAQMFFDFYVVAVLAACVALICKQRPRTRAQYSIHVLAALGLGCLSAKFDWMHCGQCFPLVCLVLLGLLLHRIRKDGLQPRLMFPAVWTVFSLMMLLKLGLASRIWHYGFVLGMPAMLSAIYLVFWLLPQELGHHNINPKLWRAVIAVPLLVGLFQLTHYYSIYYNWKNVAIGDGADRMWVYNDRLRVHDVEMVGVTEWIKHNTPKDSTLAVLPTGMMMNYYARRINPGKSPIWPPPEIAAFGQGKMMDDFVKHSPDYVVLVGVKLGDGGSYFGEDKAFGKDLMTWIGTHYYDVAKVGDDWIKKGGFGIRVLQRNPQAVKAANRSE